MLQVSNGRQCKVNHVVLRRLSAGEAQGMDPQNRLLLEQSAAALAEAAACTGAGLGGTKTGVYVGCMYQEYMQACNPRFSRKLHPAARCLCSNQYNTDTLLPTRSK